MATVVHVDPVEHWITISGEMDPESTARACADLVAEVSANSNTTWTVDCTIARHHRETLRILRAVKAALGAKGRLSVLGANANLRELIASDGL